MSKRTSSLKYISLFLLFPLFVFCQPAKEEIKRWQQQADKITIIRDNWGVPHIYGKTDADCAFGLIYAQCEDNFWQLEETFIRSLGRSSELYGEKNLESDASIALFECVKKGKKFYADANPFLKSLCNAAASAINYYLYNHPATEQRLLHHYEPWVFLITSPASPASHGITRNEMKNNFVFANQNPSHEFNDWLQQKESGSNTMALAPSKTTTGKSMLLINPHVSFFGDGQRYEAHLISEQGLNVSGFAMLGNFYIWSGFNSNVGWSHTNTASDYEDVYLEHFNNPSDPSLYQYGNGFKKEIRWYDTLFYKEGNELKTKIFLFRKTHHGPIVAKHDSLWVTVKNASNNSAEYILQSWKMCKAKNIKEFTTAMNIAQLTTNTSYADKFGNIAYWHGNAIPKRNPKFDWRSGVDGRDPETEWKGKHTMNEIVHVINPSSGWIQNCNSTPYESAGGSSPKKEKYPAYMSYEDENFRSEEAIRLLSSSGKISYEDFQKLVVSNRLPMMADWLPGIISACDKESIKHSELKIKLDAEVDTLRKWDYRYSVNSYATTLGVAFYYAYTNWIRQQDRTPVEAVRINRFPKKFPLSDSITIQILLNAVDDLQKNYGTAFIEWGNINRLQRIHTSGTLEKFDDSKPSIPVGAVPGLMGSLFAFNTRTDGGQKKMYGISGSTYVAVIEFGKKIKAKSIHYFGTSANPLSPHYFDQAALYSQAKFKDAYFYKEDILKHTERKYHPGEEKL
ncbi:MAG: penicillin acylase family protein [Bacteroidota bacterium]|nr:penicillin acylase family protein [Bacteroidota bacterium]